MQVTEIVLLVMLAVLVFFQIALALGAPLGEAAWGGKHKNVLPKNLRIASLFSAVSLLFMLLVVLSAAGSLNVYPEEFTTVVLWVMTVYFALSTIMNAVSRSKIERVWAPYSAVLCILCLFILL